MIPFGSQIDRIRVRVTRVPKCEPWRAILPYPCPQRKQQTAAPRMPVRSPNLPRLPQGRRRSPRPLAQGEIRRTVLKPDSQHEEKTTH
jgi:hypothetical protein